MSNVYQAPQADLQGQASYNGGSQVTNEMVTGLEKGASWSMFLAVLFYIGVGLLALAGLFAVFAIFAVGPVGILLVLAYALGGFIMFRLGRFMHQYSASVKAFVNSHDAYDLIESQEYFRLYMKWVVIITVFGVVFGIIAGIVGAAYMGSMY